MAVIRALFWDVGGVLGTNGWDRYARAEAVRRFALDAEGFEKRHQEAVGEFEIGRLSLEGYLDRVVFNEARSFDAGVFRDYMFSRSQPFEEALTLARSIAGSGLYLMAVLSNESRELNDYRIATFGMDAIFRVFVSSCYVGLRKPEAPIYRLALDVTQAKPAEALLIDDRQENLDTAAALGLQTVHHDGDVRALRAALRDRGVLS